MAKKLKLLLAYLLGFISSLMNVINFRLQDIDALYALGITRSYVREYASYILLAVSIVLLVIGIIDFIKTARTELWW